MCFISRFFTFLFVGFIKIYRFTLSPFFGRTCRFHPTCSKYAEESLKKHGVLRGIVLALWRILRCNPWGGHGIDPVPNPKVKRKK